MRVLASFASCDERESGDPKEQRVATTESMPTKHNLKKHTGWLATPTRADRRTRMKVKTPGPAIGDAVNSVATQAATCLIHE